MAECHRCCPALGAGTAEYRRRCYPVLRTGTAEYRHCCCPVLRAWTAECRHCCCPVPRTWMAGCRRWCPSSGLGRLAATAAALSLGLRLPSPSLELVFGATLPVHPTGMDGYAPSARMKAQVGPGLSVPESAGSDRHPRRNHDTGCNSHPRRRHHSAGPDAGRKWGGGNQEAGSEDQGAREGCKGERFHIRFVCGFFIDPGSEWMRPAGNETRTRTPYSKESKYFATGPGPVQGGQMRR